MARSFHSHWLVGVSTSVLKEDFVSSYCHGDSLVGAEPFSEDQNESFVESSPIKDRDEEFNIQEKKGRRSDFITVELPRDPMASLDITSALDHTNINNRTAMQIVSSVLKTAKKDGQQVDLNEFTLSRDTIGRRRQENRDTISKQAKQQFLDNMPARLSLHWDGKMLQDLSGELKEMEAIIVCGENYLS